MFGLEGDKKKNLEVFVFDLEKEVKDPKRLKELLQKIEGKVQRIKTLLRGGEGKEEFDKLGVLLQGYLALKKVLERIVAKKSDTQKLK